MTDPTLPPEAIRALCGGLVRPSAQVEELRRQGFWRARLGRDGRAILETAHYQAVCAGAVQAGAEVVHTLRPRITSLEPTP